MLKTTHLTEVYKMTQSRSRYYHVKITYTLQITELLVRGKIEHLQFPTKILQIYNVALCEETVCYPVVCQCFRQRHKNPAAIRKLAMSFPPISAD